MRTRRAHRPRRPPTNLEPVVRRAALLVVVRRLAALLAPVVVGLLRKVSELDLGVDVAGLGDLGVADVVLVEGLLGLELFEVLLLAEDLRRDRVALALDAI